MSTILGNPITLGGGGAKLNIDYGSTPPADTTKLWVPLATKPSAVECKQDMAFGSETSNMTQYVLPDVMSAGCSGDGAVGKYVYMIACRKSSYGSSSGFISRFDTKTGEIEDVYNIGDWLGGTFCVVGDKIYGFGGYPKKAFVYDTTNNTLTNLAAFPDNYYNYPCCAYYNNNIYIYGGFSTDSSYAANFIRVYNISGNSYSTWTIGSTLSYASSAVVVKDKLYAICGSSGNSMMYTLKIYDLNSQKYLKAMPLVNGDTSTFGMYTPCFKYGKYIYVLCASNVSGGSPYKIIRYDTERDVGAVISDDFPGNTFCALYGFVDNKLWVLGGSTGVSFVPTVSSVRTFTVSSPLTNNHLFLQEDYGYDGLWTALKSKDTDFKVKVINAYLGDSNNIAQLTDAYLYDSDSATWKSLDGVSMTADMLNALATLGVT